MQIASVVQIVLLKPLQLPKSVKQTADILPDI